MNNVLFSNTIEEVGPTGADSRRPQEIETRDQSQSHKKSLQTRKAQIGAQGMKTKGPNPNPTALALANANAVCHFLHKLETSLIIGYPVNSDFK